MRGMNRQPWISWLLQLCSKLWRSFGYLAYCSTQVALVARCLIVFFLWSFMFDSKINNDLQFGIVLNNEAIMLDSFIQIFGNS